MEFKTVTDLDRWFRENMYHIQDLFNLGKMSQRSYNYHIRKLISRHEKYTKELTRGDTI